MTILAGLVLLFAGLSLSAADAVVEQWPQFRGPAASGVGDDKAALPGEFGPGKSLLWKTPLPKGQGSPCIWGDRIFVTAYDEASKALALLAVNRKDGKILWRREVKPDTIENVHEVATPATTTPVTDGERVYVYFGSYGLLAFNLDGTPAWEHPLPVATQPFGAANSPVLAGDLILVARDFLPKPALLAVSRKDGKLAWKADLDPFRFAHSASHATPLVVGKQVILNRPTRIVGHSLEDGKLLWWVTTSSAGASTPTLHDGKVFVAVYNMGADPGAPVARTPFADALAKYDKDKDGKISQAEAPDKDLYTLRRVGFPDGVPGAHFTIKTFFRGNDTNKDGVLDEAEYNAVWDRPRRMDENNGLMAIQLGGLGDLTESAVLWKERRSVPEVPSALVYRGGVYMVANGGILTCVDEKSGKVLYRSRLNAPGGYFASPVAAGGKVLISSGDGIITTLTAGSELQVIASNDLGEPIFGTPALIGSRIYVRSMGHLWAFGAK